jgi:hypothetical protein
MKDYEVPDWIRVKRIDEKEVMMKDFGKGMRIKAKVNYKDDFDDDQLDEIFDEEESDEDGRKKRSRRSIKQYDLNTSAKKKKIPSSDEYSVNSKSNNMEDDTIKQEAVKGSNNNMKIMINTEFMSKSNC